MGMIIFTDLDGSLLDHDGYSFEAARPSLERIKQARMPLILTTSKTRREVEALQKALGINDPFIVENGGGIFFPAGYRGFPIPEGRQEAGYTLIQLGVPYEQIRSFFIALPKEFQARGFGDMSVKNVADLTGLTLDQAVLAKVREFTEPFILEREADLEAVETLAGEKGMKVTRGGRFYHLLGLGQDKGKAVRVVQDIFRRNSEVSLISIGIGDSENDLPMLQNVDIPVLIPRPRRGYLTVALPRLIRAKQPGSRGWNEAIGRLLDESKGDD